MKFSERRVEQISNEELSAHGKYHDNDDIESIIASACGLFGKEFGLEFVNWLATDPKPSVDDLSEEDRLGYALAAVTDGAGEHARYWYLDARDVVHCGAFRKTYNRLAKAVIDAYVASNKVAS